MRVIIIEDETAAAHNLRIMLEELYPQMEVVATLESVVEANEWFAANATPDVAFMDIHLADGNAFRIFDSTTISCPIIFTTAYDQYALEAFRVNSIDYLLKPLKKEDLERAISKLLLLTAPQREAYSARVNDMVVAERAMRRAHTLLVQVKDRIIPLDGQEIAFFYTCNEQVSATTLDGKCYPINGTLESLSCNFAGEDFYRANRQFIISRQAIKDVSVWFGSRLAVNLSVTTPERIIVSKARCPDFKAWLSRVV